MVRGTEITLHLKEEALEYTDPNRLKGLAQHYSEFIMYPISLRTTHTIEVEDDEEETKEETTKSDEDLEVTEEEPVDKPKKMKEETSYEWERLNTNQAIWTRDKDEVSEDEYQAFFHVGYRSLVGRQVMFDLLLTLCLVMYFRCCRAVSTPMHRPGCTLMRKETSISSRFCTCPRRFPLRTSMVISKRLEVPCGFTFARC